MAIFLRCTVPECGYQREISDRDIKKMQEFVKRGAAEVIDIDVMEEKLHHRNFFALGMLDHGKFKVEIDGKDRLVEVTRDLNSRPIFYSSGERK